jgi:carboxyl-terminal processing protease
MIRLASSASCISRFAMRALAGLSRISLTLALVGAGLLVACGDSAGLGTPSPSPVQALISPTSPSLEPPTPSPVPIVAAPLPTATPIPVTPDETMARQLRVFTHLWETVRNVYVYPDFNGLDWDEMYRRYRARIEAGMEDEGFYQAMREMIDELGDDHSAFYSPEEVAEEEEILSGQLDYVGIGIYVTILPDEGCAVLLQVFPDSPAERAGLLGHDRILAVDGMPVIDELGQEHLDRLKGPADSQVRLTAQTPGLEPRELILTRTHIQAQLRVDAYRFPGTDVGYLTIPTFWDLTIAGRVREVLEGLMAEGELDGLVLDIRINGGGLDTALQDTLSIFVDGELGAFVGQDTERPLVIEAEPVGNSQELPLVVLVGRETESFGEVFGGLLQESGRARVVGRTTEGNVETLQQVDFEDGSRAWIASETFRPLSGADWEESGIIPDLEIPLDWCDFTAETDLQLQAALDLLLQALED